MKVLAAGNALVRTLGAGPDTSPAQAIVVEGGAGVTEYATIEELVVASLGSLAPGYYEVVGEVVTHWDGTDFSPPVWPVVQYFDRYWTARSAATDELDRVASWVDLRAGGTLAQDNTANQPTLVTAQGRPALQFGTNKILLSPEAQIQSLIDATAQGGQANIAAAMLMIISGGRASGHHLGGWGQSAGTTRTQQIYNGTSSSRTYIYDSTINAWAQSPNNDPPRALLVTNVGGIGRFFGAHYASPGAQIGDDIDKSAEASESGLFGIGARIQSSPASYSNATFHAVGVAFGARAIALHNGPPAGFWDAIDFEWTADGLFGIP